MKIKRRVLVFRVTRILIVMTLIGPVLTFGFTGDAATINNSTNKISQARQEIDYIKDTDGDGLPDYYEKAIGTNIYKIDTDGDGLPDGYECFYSFTDPLKRNTVGDGIWDGDQDFDQDGLTNLEEYHLGTHPWDYDSDGDNLKDGEEVNLYGTNPMKSDTDDDALEDGDEILLGFDPLNPHTDGDGILDGDEKTLQVYEQTIEQEGRPEITKVAVSFEGTGNIENTTHIIDMYNIDVFTTDVVGLVGVPVAISTESKFDKATITFTYDPKALGGVLEKELAIMWYEEGQWYHILDKESIINTKENTISVEVPRFGTYLVVNRNDWYRAWGIEIDYTTKVK